MPNHLPSAIQIDHRVVIFVKGTMYGVVGIWSNGQRHYVGSCDPRCHPSIHEREYTHFQDAEAAFTDHVKITTDRGWTIAYDGPSQNG